jgi:hypothetical protein
MRVDAGAASFKGPHVALRSVFHWVRHYSEDDIAANVRKCLLFKDLETSAGETPEELCRRGSPQVRHYL